jgi:hypothetical protein
VTANFQFVLDKAVTEYFMWAAADDTRKPQFVERLVDVLDEHSEIVLAMSDVQNVSECGTPLHVSELTDIRLDDVLKSWSKLRPRFFEWSTSQTFFAIYGLFRTRCLRQISIDYFGSVRWASVSEMPLLAQVAVRGKIASIPCALMEYRRVNDSVFAREQTIMSRLSWVDNIANVNACLARIAIRSDLPPNEKSDALAAIARTGVPKLVISVGNAITGGRASGTYLRRLAQLFR